MSKRKVHAKMSETYTKCWRPLHWIEGANVTEDSSKVTCKHCLNALKKEGILPMKPEEEMLNIVYVDECNTLAIWETLASTVHDKVSGLVSDGVDQEDIVVVRGVAPVHRVDSVEISLDNL